MVQEMWKSTIIRLEAKCDKEEAHFLCLRCQMYLTADNKPDPRHYSQKWIDAYYKGIEDGKVPCTHKKESLLRKANNFIEERLKPPLLHGDEAHQEWLKTELRKWIPDLYDLLRGK